MNGEHLRSGSHGRLREHESGEQRQRGEKSPQNGRHHCAPQPTIAGATHFKANEERADSVRVMRASLIAAVLLLAAPAAAHAADGSIWSRDVSLGAARTPAAVTSAKEFDLVGVHWRGSGRVELRTRSGSGPWSPWRTAAPEAEDRPDSGAPERTRPGWRVGSPWWAPGSTRLEVRTVGRVTRVRAWFVRSPAARVPIRQVAFTGSPKIVPRSGWRADEKIVRSAPRYAPVLRFSVVHHTAGSSSYRPEESAAIVRGIELYHVKANGWNDIGYNFLVDRYGQVFEGRGGGMQRNVIGAHAAGFNSGSVGIASSARTRASRRPLKRRARSRSSSRGGWTSVTSIPRPRR